MGWDAHLSGTTIARLKEKWQLEHDEWSLCPLISSEVVYLWVDGVCVKAGLAREKAALLVAVAGPSDGRKEIVALVALIASRSRPGRRSFGTFAIAG